MTGVHIDKPEFEVLSEFRHQLSRFLRFSEDAARREGLTPLQYLLLLHVQGFSGRDWATVGELAERLQMRHNAAVALVTRCEALGLVARSRGAGDGRVVEVRLLAPGRRHLDKLAALHRSELQSLEGTFRVARLASFNQRDAA